MKEDEVGYEDGEYGNKDALLGVVRWSVFFKVAFEWDERMSRLYMALYAYICIYPYICYITYIYIPLSELVDGLVLNKGVIWSDIGFQCPF